MKYFRVENPYFALIRAESEENAIKKYANEVCQPDGEETNPIELTQEEVLILALDAKNEDGTPLTNEEIAEIINSDTEEVVLVDASLC